MTDAVADAGAAAAAVDNAAAAADAGANDAGADKGAAQGDSDKSGAADANAADKGSDGSANDADKGKGADKSIADGGGNDNAKDVVQKWPDDWRQQLAGDDAKRLEKLGRFDSPAAILKALEDTQKKISEGLKPKARPDAKATAEELAAYRKEAGIPETVDDYVKAIELPDKRVIGDEDKPVVSAFAERALAKNIPPKDIAELVDEYYAIQEEQVALQAEKDAEFKNEAMKGLREEWGGDFKANVNAMRPYFEGVEPELFDNLMGGRLSDGTKIGDHPGMIRFFVAKSLQENPAATVVPAGGNQIETIQNEIATLEKRMGEDRNAWFKDKPAQERLQKLYEAQEKLAPKK